MNLRFGWLVVITRWPALFVLLALVLFVGAVARLIRNRRRLAAMDDDDPSPSSRPGTLTPRALQLARKTRADSSGRPPVSQRGFERPRNPLSSLIIPVRTASIPAGLPLASRLQPSA